MISVREKCGVCTSDVRVKCGVSTSDVRVKCGNCVRAMPVRVSCGDWYECC